MLALGQFTIEELKSATEIGEATVRTVVNRHRDLLQTLGAEPTGDRGGQPNRYRIREDKREALRLKLKEAYSAMTPLATPTSEAAPANAVPPSVIVSRDLLARRLPAATGEQRDALLRLARSVLQTADEELNQALRETTDPRLRQLLQAHVEALTLLRTIRHEYAAFIGDNKPRSPVVSAQMRHRLLELARVFAASSDEHTAMALLRSASPDTVGMLECVVWDSVNKRDHFTPRVTDALNGCDRVRVHVHEGDDDLSDADLSRANLVCLTVSTTRSFGRPLKRAQRCAERLSDRLVILDEGFDKRMLEAAAAKGSKYVPGAKYMSRSLLLRELGVLGPQ